jgi:hypothetical protein
MAHGRALTITVRPKSRLSQTQLRFNKLTARISKLEREIGRITARLEKLFAVYARDVSPIALAYARANYDTSARLHTFAGKSTLRKTQTESVRAMILELSEQAFLIAAPTRAQRDIYDAWRSLSIDEMPKDKGKHDGNGGRPARSSKTSGPVRPPALKSKLQMAAELSSASAEAVKERTIRSVYIGLAKVLHPDTDVDQRGSDEKGELMKQVTGAYADRDLTKLLRLEVEWVENESHQVDLRPDETVKIYISALEDQVAVLKEERAQCAMHPRYAPVVRLIALPEPAALAALERAAAHYSDATADLVQLRNIVDSLLPPNEILKHIKDYAHMHELH